MISVLLRGSEQSEARTLTTVGVAVVLCVVALLATVKVFDPFGGRVPGNISVVIDTPFVGEGVVSGAAVVLHGVKVGQVTDVTSLPTGAVRLDADLESGPVTGLTNTMKIDFRPVNYFGVTGINLIAGSGGTALADGMRINTVPKGNFTLQALLYRLGEISATALTPKLIKLVDRGSRYLDALDPLLETMLIATDAVAKVQTVSTAQLLSNTTKLSVPLPAFLGALISAGAMYVTFPTSPFHISTRDMSEEGIRNRVHGLEVWGRAVFGGVGTLISSHVSDLLPLIDTIKPLVDVVPPLVKPDEVARTLSELRSRFEKLYGGVPGQPALNVRVALDSLPGVAGPLGLTVGR